jgi:nitroimidazol reductase NimA-like FMN-containing flavoprotein (pyridoxamine 5'-phosphate oxidase superfamily)
MEYNPTDRTRLRRRPARGSYDPQVVHAILDEALVCHVGFVVEGRPVVLPTAFVRDGETVFIHGAVASGMLRALEHGVPACLEVTLLDGLVLARSAFHHSVNYRSVVVFGTARAVQGPDKARALARLVEKLSPGRSAAARAPTDKELDATSVLAIDLVEVSAKIRVGGPIDDPEDMTHPVWTGVIPLALRAGAPLPAAEDASTFGPPATPRL